MLCLTSDLSAQAPDTGPADDDPRHTADSRHAVSVPVKPSGKAEITSSVFHRFPSICVLNDDDERRAAQVFDERCVE